MCNYAIKSQKYLGRGRISMISVVKIFNEANMSYIWIHGHCHILDYRVILAHDINICQ